MPLKTRDLVMLVVAIAWLVYLVAELARGVPLPLPFWSVPGATYALLSNKITGIRFGASPADLEVEKGEE